LKKPQDNLPVYYLILDQIKKTGNFRFEAERNFLECASYFTFGSETNQSTKKLEFRKFKRVKSFSKESTGSRNMIQDLNLRKN
jgi:hypothetical protein